MGKLTRRARSAHAYLFHFRLLEHLRRHAHRRADHTTTRKNQHGK